jgi:hypothetical protein
MHAVAAKPLRREVDGLVASASQSFVLQSRARIKGFARCRHRVRRALLASASFTDPRLTAAQLTDE